MSDAEPARRDPDDELARQRRLVDQSASMQATLRDWDRALGTALVCLVLIASVIALAFAFAGGGKPVTLLGIRATRATWLGWLAIGTFALALVELVLDLRGAARRRADAVKVLADLKSGYRALPGAATDTDRARLSAQYGEVMSSVPEIPNVLFNRLKAAHLRKVEISKIISASPGVTFRAARRQLRRRTRKDMTRTSAARTR